MQVKFSYGMADNFDLIEAETELQQSRIDLHRIATGKKAMIRVDAYPDSIFEGEVASIGRLATRRYEGTKGEKYFQLIISLKGNDLRLRPGMTTRSSILSDRVKDALTASVQAIFYEASKPYCYVHKNRGYNKLEITVGRQNEGISEILSGLKKGDIVSLVMPSSDKLRKN